MARVLVVEDEPSVAIALRDSLESDDHQVTLAGDGSEGFRLASQTGDDAPDLILLDLMLPKMSGLEICQRLRAVGIETPMIMLTARGAASDAAFGLKLGASQPSCAAPNDDNRTRRKSFASAMSNWIYAVCAPGKTVCR